MTEVSEPTLIFDPVELVAPDARLFIDTNVFMETSPERIGGLQKLFARVAPKIEEGGSPVIVPMKVVSELTKQSVQKAGEDEPGRAEAINKAANALVFLKSASEHGLIRKDLGDDSNPYADDLFVNLFTAYAGRYSMALLTNDITLLLRVNLIGIQRGAWLVAGRLTSEGLIECEVPQVLYERGLAKLRRIQRRLGTPEAAAKDSLEAESLQEVLQEFASATNVVEPKGATAVRHHQAPEIPPATVADPFPADSSYRGEDSQLPVLDVPGEGDDVLVETPTGTEKLRLSDKLGTGGEGSVYSASPTQVIKIFDEAHITGSSELRWV